MNELLNDFVIGNGTQGGVDEDETVGPQDNDFVDNSVSGTPGENTESHNHIIEGNIANRVREEIFSVVAAVKIWARGHTMGWNGSETDRRISDETVQLKILAKGFLREHEIYSTTHDSIKRNIPKHQSR